MFTILATKRQVQKLNKQLEETESLVQDLQEELEMKQELNVKEVVEFEEDSDHQKAMNKIEAELEAELERLEINIRQPIPSHVEVRVY